MQPIDRYDKPYVREYDYGKLTIALYFSGYLPFRLVRQDNGQVQVVWAKNAKEVLAYAPGDVSKLARYAADNYQVIVIDLDDGGYVNEHGLIIGRGIVL